MDASTIREDDTNWPKKNIVGKQEMEIRLGNDHIAFEVRVNRVHLKPIPIFTDLNYRQQKSDLLSMCKIARTRKVFVSSIISSKISR